MLLVILLSFVKFCDPSENLFMLSRSWVSHTTIHPSIHPHTCTFWSRMHDLFLHGSTLWFYNRWNASMPCSYPTLSSTKALSTVGKCCRSKPTGEQRQATRRAGRSPGRWQALLPRRRPAIPAHAAACEDAGHATWPIPDPEGANVLAMICLHTQTRGNISPSRGRLPGTTLASALKSRSSPGVRWDLLHLDIDD